MPAKYVELHARSAFSFLEGASLPEDLASRCAAYEQEAMAVTDVQGVYGAPRFHLAAKKQGLRALIGSEVNAANGSRYTLLVENRTGYQNLCRLMTRTKFRSGLPGKALDAYASEADFAEFATGLVCLTGGDEGEVAKIFREHEGPAALEEARRHLYKLLGLFGRENVYVELQRHYHRDQELRNQALVELARELHLPVIATNGVTQETPERRDLQDVLTALHHKTTLANAGKLLSFNAERHMKTSAEMARLFSDLPEALANTTELAGRLQFTLKDLGYEFPRYPLPAGEDENSYLRYLTEEGARLRYKPDDERARRQIDHELAIIAKLNLAGYFLIVSDIIDFCRREKILVQGRGSAANSAVCYSLGITAVDPVGMELLFERFLSEQRGEMPDIDLDLPSGDQRERAIQYLYKRYGRLGAAMTANVITYRARSAVRDIGKALDLDEEEIARLAAQLNTFEWRDPKDTLERRFRAQGFNLSDPRVLKFFTLTTEILELPRHIGQHSGGMVICQGQLDTIVPLEPATMPDRVVVQWDKDDCADLGIVKVDLLGLGMMAVLEDTIQIIRDAYGETVDLAHLPQNDPAVYDSLQKADTVGLFQVESRAQMSCLPRLKPACFYDIVVQVAIIRPGPIVGQMLHPYLKRRQGLEEPVCLHPSLEPVLKRTLGVPLFQEQLIKIAMIVAGFSGGQAEELRRAFGFKRSEKRMREVEVQLREGMDRNGITGETQDRIIKAITSFALYGFPESHAASFALIAYASAYLKCHYLAAFLTAMLNNQPMGFYSPATLVKDAQRHGQRFRPVDVLRSDYLCTVEVEGKAKYVRLGLNYVRGLASATARKIEHERKQEPFRSLRDLIRRVPELQKDEIDALAELGALNALPKQKSDRHRRGALWQAELALQPVGELLEPAADDSVPSPLAPMNDDQRTFADFSNSGLTIGVHPMKHFRARVAELGALDAETAKAQRDGMFLKVAGCVITRQRPGTAKGFVFLSLEDETGIINIIVQPDLFDRKRKECTVAPYVLVKGVLQSVSGVISVKAGDIEALHFAEGAAVSSHDFH
ncbi:MAG TPA: error-prone DNA polymerase [Bryobacteraceae bacterium]|jgi:error-prone DNA polymerase|nr:error-prone DNA polymerase [Bryobacteraceae bacterium]